VPLLRRKLGIIFQDFQLLNDRTVAENLIFVMKATGWKDSTKMKARMNEVLMNVGLGSIEKKMPHQLSGGEQQRVVIARALINEPLILLADEPTGNLDPEVSQGILKIFQQINKSGTAIFMATHSYGLIKKYPARVLKCEDGKVIDSVKEPFELSTETWN
jgi:cell division transport system ATP-binding protein